MIVIFLLFVSCRSKAVGPDSIGLLPLLVSWQFLLSVFSCRKSSCHSHRWQLCKQLQFCCVCKRIGVHGLLALPSCPPLPVISSSKLTSSPVVYSISLPKQVILSCRAWKCDLNYSIKEFCIIIGYVILSVQINLINYFSYSMVQKSIFFQNNEKTSVVLNKL